jgi:hypothetical protein
MATPVADPPARNDIELPPAVHWPTVYLMAGIGGGVAVVLLAVAVIAAVQPTPPAAPSASAALARPAPAPPHHADPVATPTVQKATESEPPEWKSLVPPPARPTPPVAAGSPPVPVAPEDAAAAETTPQPTDPSPSPHDSLSSSELLADLQASARSIDLSTVDGTSARLLAKCADDRLNGARIVDLVAHRPDLTGLPLRAEAAWRQAPESAKYLGEISIEVRGAQAEADRLKQRSDDDSSYDRQNERDARLIHSIEDLAACADDKIAPGLAQMLCVETVPVRLELTRVLAGVKGRTASLALAQQALFDVTPEVRTAAIKALKDRPREEYRQALLDGFRYPWPPVAGHAAAALTAVDDRAAAKDLTKLLRLPDPLAPMFTENKKWVKAELVKVNHLRNCLLCHAPSSSREDPVRGFIPEPGEEIPVAYYAEAKGNFVRADVTYLKQDFSVMESVPNSGKWPSMQRFDYLIRRRELTVQELNNGPSPGAKRWETYPQKEAVRLTLERLVGKAPEPSSPSGEHGGPTP